MVDEGDVVAVGLRFHLQAFQHGREVFMGQTAETFIHKQHADVIGTVGFQRSGSGIGHVAHLLRHLTDSYTGFLSDIRLTVQRLTHRRHRNPAGTGNILHGNHVRSLPIHSLSITFSHLKYTLFPIITQCFFCIPGHYNVFC